MTCREMEGVIITSGHESEVAEHVAECERCRRLVWTFGENRQFSPPSSEQMKRIEAVMLGNLIPVQPLASPRALFSAFALVFLAIVAAGSSLLGTDGWRVLNIFQKIVVFLPMAAGAGLLALSLVRLMAPGSKHAVSPARSSIGVLLSLALVIATVFPSQGESGFVPAGLRCLRTGLACAVPAGVLFWSLVRRGAILSPGLTGAIAGGLAGLVGMTVLEVRCPILSGYHILVWHCGVALLAMPGGLALAACRNRQA